FTTFSIAALLGIQSVNYFRHLRFVWRKPVPSDRIRAYDERLTCVWNYSNLGSVRQTAVGLVKYNLNLRSAFCFQHSSARLSPKALIFTSSFRNFFPYHR